MYCTYCMCYAFIQLAEQVYLHKHHVITDTWVRRWATTWPQLPHHFVSGSFHLHYNLTGPLSLSAVCCWPWCRSTAHGYRKQHSPQYVRFRRPLRVLETYPPPHRADYNTSIFFPRSTNVHPWASQKGCLKRPQMPANKHTSVLKGNPMPVLRWWRPSRGLASVADRQSEQNTTLRE